MNEAWKDRLGVAVGLLIIGVFASITGIDAHFDGDVIKMVRAYRVWKNPPYVMPPAQAHELFWKELHPNREIIDRANQLTSFPSAFQQPLLNADTYYIGGNKYYAYWELGTRAMPREVLPPESPSPVVLPGDPSPSLYDRPLKRDKYFWNN